MKHLISAMVAVMLVTGSSSCNKDISASSLPQPIRNFIFTYYPGKGIIRSEFRDYNPGPYSGQSVHVSVPLDGYGSSVTVINSNSNFNYGSWGQYHNQGLSGIYTVTLEGNIVLEFTSAGFFIRRIR